jgi:diguanylate cyclase (GGDEF)-like protein
MGKPMFPRIRSSLQRRFRLRVILPGGLVLLATAALCGAALVGAGHGTDQMSVMGQQLEVLRATGTGLDELALGQESVGLCAQCIAEAASPHPDAEWLDANVGLPLFDLYKAHETYILDGRDRPVYALVQRHQAAPSTYARVAPAVNRFVELARGTVKRPSGRSNLNERLPGSPSLPVVLPPPPGVDAEFLTLFPTVPTTPSVRHATDLVRIGDRVAFVSAMQMTRIASGNRNAAPPMLVSLRYLDDQFLLEVSKENHLAAPRLGNASEPREGEVSTPLLDSDGTMLATMFWKPALPGAAVISSLLLPATGAFGMVATLVLLMTLALRRLMKRDEEQLRELERAHLELKAKEAQAHHLAYHDVLTALPNRALFNDKTEQALIRSRHGERAAILLLDLDRFKNVNDRFGHLAGDALIREVARRLSAVVGAEAVARLGGDEFAILIENDRLGEALEPTLDRILAELRRPFEIVGNQAHVGVSIGVALAPECGIDRTELMRKADIALYRAKDEGRDCYRFFTEAMDETVQLRAFLEADLRVALANGEELCVHYQPQVDTLRRKVVGLEALLRWQHPTRGCIPPHLFVPVAEETGLISTLGDWVLGEACKVAREWPKLTVAVNLSPVQFCDDGFAERVCRLVDEAGVDPRQIELEVTEGVVLDQNETVRGALERLRSEGFSIALDDFGTGYSSFSYLREFEVDKIKIDKSFIQKLGQTVDAGSIITAVVTLGRAMGLEVTAEGVETEDQEAFLRRAGCSQLQGFRFSRAVPADRLRRSLEECRRREAA